jgi:hypothetical protein
MAPNNWQAIAVVIAAIIAAIAAVVGPCAAVLLKAFIDQPKAKPKPSQPTSFAARAIVWLRVAAIVLLPFGLLSSILLLTLALLMAHSPLTSFDVFAICYAVGGLYFHPVSFALMNLIAGQIKP